MLPLGTAGPLIDFSLGTSAGLPKRLPSNQARPSSSGTRRTGIWMVLLLSSIVPPPLPRHPPLGVPPWAPSFPQMLLRGASKRRGDEGFLTVVQARGGRAARAFAVASQTEPAPGRKVFLLRKKFSNAEGDAGREGVVGLSCCCQEDKVSGGREEARRERGGRLEDGCLRTRRLLGLPRWISASERRRRESRSPSSSKRKPPQSEPEEALGFEPKTTEARPCTPSF